MGLLSQGREVGCFLQPWSSIRPEDGESHGHSRSGPIQMGGCVLGLISLVSGKCGSSNRSSGCLRCCHSAEVVTRWTMTVGTVISLRAVTPSSWMASPTHRGYGGGTGFQLHNMLCVCVFQHFISLRVAGQ